MKTPAGYRGWGQTAGLTALLFLLVATLSTIPVIRDWQVRLTDTFFRLSAVPAQKSRVVLVPIDDESLQRYGRWPWSRTLLAKLTTNLTQAGASVVGLDILLSEPQTEEADRALQQALQEGHTVIVDKIASYPDGPQWMEPLPLFGESSGVGHAQAVLDADSVCRRYPAHYVTLNGPRWAFAVEVARRTDPQPTASFLTSYGVPVGDDSAPVSLAKSTLVRIPYRRGGFETISAATALHALDPAKVRGRPVLVGFGSAELGDRLSTPLDPEFPASGIEVHAQILDAILNGRTLREPPLGIAALLLLVTCCAVITIFRKWRGFAALGGLLITGTAVYGVAFLVFLRGSLILPAGSMLLAIAGAPLLVYTADFVRVERSVTQQLLGLRSWLALRGKDRETREKTDLSWRLELLQQLQTELGSLYELHTALLESTQDLIAIFDEQGRLLLNNRAFERAHGSGLDVPLTLARVRALWSTSSNAPLIANGPIEEGEVTLGRELYSARIAPMPSTRLSPAGGTIVTLTSLRTRVERDRARAEALSFITHELRTPLASVQGFAELMMAYPNSPACANAPETIFRESKRLLALISSYLDVLRLDAGAKSVAMQVIELDGIIQQVFDILRPLANAAGMRLVFEDNEPLSIMGDAPLVNGAVLNLVSNAIKYGQPGDIKVRCFRGDNEVIISVHNLGQPLAEQEISRLFDPYYRASNAGESKTGWGLGLAFVKRIAEKHGGSVAARSEPSGVVFEIHLPAQPVPAVVTKEIS